MKKVATHEPEAHNHALEVHGTALPELYHARLAHGCTRIVRVAVHNLKNGGSTPKCVEKFFSTDF